METETRAQHLAWCKKRALEYLPHDPENAIASMLSGLSKHPETANHVAIELTFTLVMGGFLSTPEKVRKHIEGFN